LVDYKLFSYFADPNKSYLATYLIIYEMKKNINTLFKSGESFTFSKVNFSGRTVRNNTKLLRERQAKILKFANVDLEVMRKIKFGI
jgi:hypothetical protein